MSTVKSKKLQVGTDATSSNNFTIYQPATPDGTLRIGVGNADSPTEVGQFNANGYKPATAPLFSAHGVNQSVSNATDTKVQFSKTTIDTTGDYDTTNYRWTPSVAGYYQIQASIHFDGKSSTGNCRLIMFKNGALYRAKYTVDDPDITSNNNLSISQIVYCNGTTDYIEMYFNHNFGVTSNIFTSSNGLNDYDWFQGYLIQQA